MESKEYIIFYKDDDDSTKQSGCTILELNVAYVKFLNNRNQEIILPIDRVLKIKEVGEKE